MLQPGCELVSMRIQTNCLCIWCWSSLILWKPSGNGNSLPKMMPGMLWGLLTEISLSVSSLPAAAAPKSLQSCPTLCDPIDSSPPGSPVPGILQARTLECVAISFSNAWKWKVKVKSLSRVWLLATPWTAAHQVPPSMGCSRQEYWSGVPLPSPSSPPRRYKKLIFSLFLETGLLKVLLSISSLSSDLSPAPQMTELGDPSSDPAPGWPHHPCCTTDLHAPDGLWWQQDLTPWEPTGFIPPPSRKPGKEERPSSPTAYSLLSSTPFPRGEVGSRRLPLLFMLAWPLNPLSYWLTLSSLLLNRAPALPWPLSPL